MNMVLYKILTYFDEREKVHQRKGLMAKILRKPRKDGFPGISSSSVKGTF